MFGLHWIIYVHNLLHFVEASWARLVANQVTGVQVFAGLVVEESACSSFTYFLMLSGEQR